MPKGFPIGFQVAEKNANKHTNRHTHTHTHNFRICISRDVRYARFYLMYSVLLPRMEQANLASTFWGTSFHSRAKIYVAPIPASIQDSSERPAMKATPLYEIKIPKNELTILKQVYIEIYPFIQ